MSAVLLPRVQLRSIHNLQLKEQTMYSIPFPCTIQYHITSDEEHVKLKLQLCLLSIQLMTKGDSLDECYATSSSRKILQSRYYSKELSLAFKAGSNQSVYGQYILSSWHEHVQSEIRSWGIHMQCSA